MSITNRLNLNKPVLKTLVRLYLSFAAVLALFIGGFNVEWVHLRVVVPFTSLVAGAASLLMNLFGAGSYVSENILSTSSYSISIVDGCNGIYATAILISGVVAYPSSIREKGLGILLGVTAVFAMNLVRVISLFYLGQHYPSIFTEAHVYVWQPIIILWAIFVWDYWSRKVHDTREAK
ncbi:MAG: exosortase H [candidate division Zixibacteria bacterium]|nr:exosortase H [candidate division Zixibacteria bacterium]